MTFPVLYITVSSGNSLSQAQADVSSVLADQFLLGSTTRLGTLIKYSTVISAIHALDGVSYVSMVFEIKKSLSSTYSSEANWGALLEATDILPESARVFVDGVYAVTDNNSGDGTGTFTASGISGTINYSTGLVLLDVSPAASAVFVRYQQEENNNLVPSFNQIAKLDTIDVQSIVMED